MNRSLFFLITVLCFCRLNTAAQTPNLPTKGTLSQTLLSGKSFSSSSLVDTVVKPWSLGSEYTLEVVATANGAVGRGLDIEARNGGLKGFRLSLDTAALKATAPLAAVKTLSASDAGKSQVIRVAVKNDSAFYYQNGAFLLSQPLSTIKDMVNGAETEQISNAVTGSNLIPNWAGTATNTSGAPSAYGWAYTGTTVTNLFNTANSGSGVRYIDVTATANQHTYNGSAFVGRIMYIRWDNSSYQNAVFSYPVTLDSNATYDFSMLYSLTANASPTKTLTVGIGKTVAATDRIASKVFTSTNTLKDLKKDDFYFTSREAGQYYITITGEFALYSIAQLSLNKFTVTPRLIFGKNYASGAVSLQITSVTYEDSAYAPGAIVTQPKQTVNLSGSSVQVPTSFNKDFIVSGKTDVHLNAENTPFVNSTFALDSSDAWLFFDNIKPSVVIANWLNKITVNNVSAANNPNVRVAIYKNGTVVIPKGNLTSQAALQVFNQPALAGSSQTYAIQVYNNNLGTFDNSIRSFKLKRGYMATLANSADGSGYSRVFIANDSDLVVNTMPAGLDTTVSFIRVFKWNWPTKKGKAGWDPNKLNATWYYDWNIGGSAADNYEYALIRQNNGWPSFTDIGNKTNVNHLLGFNEPDQTNQANLTVDQAVSGWPGMMNSGLRIGSPAPASPESSWITNFLAKTDSLNYRVDFVAIHCYWGGQTPSQWYSRLKAIYNRVKRPLWITEWNNGANWTTETWPTDQAAQFQKQLDDLKGILQVLDTASFVERYAEYDWVENKRSLVLADTLTPAGKYYAANKSDFAYNPQMAFVHTWKLVAPPLSSAINNNDYLQATLSWTDKNGELGSKYILERKIDGRDAGFVTAQEFTGYTMGGNMSFTDSVYSKASYRIRAIALDGTTFTYSGVLDVIRDAAPIAPTSVTGTVVSATKLRINWNAGTAVRSYNLKRSLSATGPFQTISARTTALTHLDENLMPDTTYYYTVTTLNSAGESDTSRVLALRTPVLAAPAGVLNPRIASGDTRVTLTWDAQFDARYTILRSTTQNGVYDTVIANLDALRYDDTAKVNNNLYYYKMVAANEAGTGPESGILAAKPVLGQHLYISFNENSGALAKDEWGGYNGTLYSTVAWSGSKDSSAGAVKLDGTANAYASLSEGPLTNLNDFTLATWVKLDALSNWMRIFDFGTGTSKYMFLTPQVSVTNGLSLVRYAIKNGGAEQTVSSSYPLPLNTWTNFAIAQSGSTVKLYVNGRLAATNTGITIKPSDLGSTNLNYIGRSQFSADPMLRASMDEFRIYNYAMTDSAVFSLVNDGRILPVKWAGFTAKAQNGQALLNWATASESNSLQFDIERSADGHSFYKIGELAAKGTATTLSEYAFVDGQPLNGYNYYRLKQLDRDGKFDYSSVKAVSFSAEQKTGIYPNPATSWLFISGLEAKTYQYRLFNAAGNTVSQGTVQAGKIRLPNELTSGAYVLQLKENENLIMNRQIVVQK